MTVEEKKLAEAEARELIDDLLSSAGWSVQDYQNEDFSASLGIAVREFQLKTGAADYLLFINRKVVGVIEAKPIGHTLGGVDVQSEKYVEGLVGWIEPLCVDPDFPIPFLYESTGVVTYFRDLRDPDSRSRKVFAFHRPETLRDWLKEPDTLRERIRSMPPLEKSSLRDCQFDAILNLEKSLSDQRPRALIQMATGTGKTYMTVEASYRLIKHAKAKRILFLVDRNNLGRQAFREFRNYRTPDDGRRLEELYNIQHMTSNAFDDVSKVTICTIQRLYSMLSGKEYDPDSDEESLYEVDPKNVPPKEVEYNTTFPIETFDFIVTDECHRSIYNLWSQVLEYFDAFIIGLTATPSRDTLGFFDQNLVMEYSHLRAVADGVNVGYDVYYIETAITRDGSHIPQGFTIKTRDVTTRKELWKISDGPITYPGSTLDRDVVAPDQIRTIIKTFKEKLFTEIFPGRKQVPKTIIFSKNDSHADDILHIVREEFGKGNDFAKKITYKTTGETPENLIKSFRNSPLPRIVVSVDMIATGTDIRPVECLLFMRDVKSRIYFEQMKGRGTRVISPTELRAVTSDAYKKTHFVVVDAVGVTDSDKTDSRPLERKRSLSFKDLIQRIQYGNRDDDTISSLSNRLARLNQNLDKKERENLSKTLEVSLNDLVNKLLTSIDIDAQTEIAKERFNTEEPTKSQLSEIKNELVNEACKPFDKAVFRNKLIEVHQKKNQIIDTYSPDKLIDWGYIDVSRAQKTITSFQKFIEQNKDELVALQVFYNQPYGQRQITHKMVKELADALDYPPYELDPARLWQAYKQLNTAKVRGTSTRRQLTNLISILKYELQETDTLIPFPDAVEQNYQEWLQRQEQQGTKFTKQQIAWLEMIKHHLIGSLSIELKDLQDAPFQQQGGIIKARQLFGQEISGILREMNTVLVI